MKPWDELTERGKLRRLRSVAAAALGDYDVDARRVSLIGGFVNALYRVDTPDGPLALRVDLVQEHTDENMLIELSWLEALDGLVDVSVPRRTKQGELFTRASVAGVPDERRCVLFSWVPGRPLADRYSPELFEPYGRISAALHVHGATHPTPTKPMAWDRVFYFSEEVDPVVYHVPENAARLPKGGLEVIERTIELVQPRLEVQGERQIVHGDLHLWNVHVSRGRLWALDFADVMWASRAQDLAITFYYFQGRPDADELSAAFRRGYEQIAPWPTDDEELAVFMAARRVMMTNFVFNIDMDDLDGFLAGSVERLQGFLDTYE
ncbi:MAG: phosphotransferase [Acidimicrobiia bacterium]|nr:phosphotransferase [Acidimicrobiia bacterium]